MHASEIAFLRGDLGLAVASARRAVAHIEANGTGVPDVWPWFVLARLHWWIGDGEGAARIYLELPQSSAWHAAALPAVRFLSVAWKLPRDADAAAAVLELDDASDGVAVPQITIDHFCAQALHRLGRNAESLAILDLARNCNVADGFVVRAEELAALRLDVLRTLGADTLSVVVALSEPMLQMAPPLLALRLHRSLAAALRAADEGSRAEAHERAAHLIADRLGESLDDEPELRASFAALYGEPGRLRKSPEVW